VFNNALLNQGGMRLVERVSVDQVETAAHLHPNAGAHLFPTLAVNLICLVLRAMPALRRDRPAAPFASTLPGALRGRRGRGGAFRTICSATPTAPG
jgi:hypothetical protein